VAAPASEELTELGWEKTAGRVVRLEYSKPDILV